ncbi:MAG: hypothetical protein Q8865_01770, partial [Bacillota bacterium]|nr:hypothetical protein [Bacillota bacterium]
MNVLVRAYTILNAGDDLYLHTLFRRYPECYFTVVIEDNSLLDAYKKAFSAYQNVTMQKRQMSF